MCLCSVHSSNSCNLRDDDYYARLKLSHRRKVRGGGRRFGKSSSVHQNQHSMFLCAWICPLSMTKNI